MADTQRSLDKGLPEGLPWNGTIGLLLDGVSVPRLAQRLYQWADSPVFEALYLHTRFAELRELSPCLVHIPHQHHPILVQFLLASRQEWGVLVFSEQPWQHMVSHFRWLVSVVHPLGEEVLLRIADPAVVHILLEHAGRIQSPTLFGPCNQFVSADTVRGCWHLDRRPGNTPKADHGRRYRLSDEQICLLDDVNFRNVLLRLNRHMHDYFPDYQTQATPQQRWQHLQQLASAACARGFNSELDITLYANIHGLLGVHALEKHTDLNTLLDTPSGQTPTQRIQHIAQLAERRAEAEQWRPV